MKKHRKEYFLSDKYRKTIKVGEECIAYDINDISSRKQMQTPTRLTITDDNKKARWLESTIDDRLTFGYSVKHRPINARLLLVRECDLTKCELAELVAIKLKHAVNK